MTLFSITTFESFIIEAIIIITIIVIVVSSVVVIIISGSSSNGTSLYHDNDKVRVLLSPHSGSWTLATEKSSFP